jgi:hypothetical protein
MPDLDYLVTSDMGFCSDLPPFQGVDPENHLSKLLVVYMPRGIHWNGCNSLFFFFW